MTQEEKQLLLKDLCARLLYRVIAYASEINKNGIITDVNIPYNMVNLTVDNDSGKYELVPLSDIKPYLRSMSSMTEEEAKEIQKINWQFCQLKNGECYVGDADDGYCSVSQMADILGYLNKHHFDYRGLIEKGLALEAPEDMYKTE